MELELGFEITFPLYNYYTHFVFHSTVLQVQDLPVRLLLDVMHCEKNICKYILKTIMGEKDTAAVRLEMQQMGIRPQLWLQEGARNRLYLLDAPYVLSAEDRREFMDTLRSIKTPSCYVSTLHSRISNGKLRGLKSHDYHILMQQIIPVCLRNVGDTSIVSAIMKVSRIFQRLCAKVIHPAGQQRLLEGRYYHASGERRAVIWRAVSNEKSIIVKNISYFRNYF